MTQLQTKAVCDPQTSLTKSLLGYGVLAGPLYVTVSLAQALTRTGFDLSRHPWSFLSNGDLGWIQITNFVVAGLTTLAAAAGIGRATRSAWLQRLLAVYGLSLIGAGIFRADPALGFPAGTPEVPGVITWHGTLHFVCGGIGFTCLVVACLIMARRFSGESRTGWAVYSAVSGAVFAATFVAVGSGGGAAWSNLAFVGGVLVVWTWFSLVSRHLYKRV
ncbi:hypothetical protein Aph01nite_04660 [Acrocarpospora phusangensis]|uniref:DUF998 domain-containing protein n=1 Tax=Acrocarpospora phusangensis TaxID=1070424 RepID=A0A919UI10_9ACTN|nr:DUF998 domain-containing protein [Acrocarpospora phusangensis]GIH22156.1 hypothetical protein Aph01nite_04660 [Acrocarpospora phusangensis]